MAKRMMKRMSKGKKMMGRKMKKSTKATKKTKRATKTSTKKMGKKRPLNAYFKLVIDAKKKNLPSFQYNGNTYVQKKHKHLIVYKRK